jgi:putative ABC transport system ATP-binding protein
MITIEHCTKIFGAGTPNHVRALDDVSLEIATHEFIIVIGTNGSGKSTLLNAIAGTIFPDAGRITIDGVDVTRMDAHRRARFIGRVFQNPFSGTAPTMTVGENLRLASLRGARKGLRLGLGRDELGRIRERASELGMGLEDRIDTPMGLLSGGQRQALTLLMATLREPRILLLDEHTAALDPKSAEQVMELTNAIIARHKLTALMVTHDMAEAVGYGSRLVMMHAGTIHVDYSGDAKQSLTPEMLLERFADLRRVPAVG